MGVKEGSPRKHTQSVQRPLRAAGPGVPGPFENSSGFTIKVKIYFFILTDRKICNGKNKGLALLDPFSYCFKMTLQKNVLLIDLRPCFHFYFSLLLQKTFFPNRSLLLRVLMGVQKRGPETHKAGSGQSGRPGRNRICAPPRPGP